MIVKEVNGNIALWITPVRVVNRNVALWITPVRATTPQTNNLECLLKAKTLVFMHTHMKNKMEHVLLFCMKFSYQMLEL